MAISVHQEGAAVLQAIMQSVPASGRRVVFVCGLGGSGKSMFCSDIVRSPQLQDAVAVRSDWYLVHDSPVRKRRIARAIKSHNQERITKEENPRNWYDWDRFAADLANLKNSGHLRIPDAWNQTTGYKSLKIDLHAGKDSFIFCDGIYLLHQATVWLSDVVLFLHVPRELARLRAEKRDSHRSDPFYLAYKQELVEKYDIPYLRTWSHNASLIVDNTDFKNPRLMETIAESQKEFSAESIIS